MYNDFEVNSKEARYQLASRFVLIFLFSQATGEKSVSWQIRKSLYSGTTAWSAYMRISTSSKSQSQPRKAFLLPIGRQVESSGSRI